jgi:hypothetical protein
VTEGIGTRVIPLGEDMVWWDDPDRDITLIMRRDAEEQLWTAALTVNGTSTEPLSVTLSDWTAGEWYPFVLGISDEALDFIVNPYGALRSARVPWPTGWGDLVKTANPRGSAPR